MLFVALAGSTGALSYAPVTGAGPAAPPLRLHPQVDCYHPLGEAHTDKQVLDALKLFRHLVKGALGLVFVQCEVLDLLWWFTKPEPRQIETEVRLEGQTPLPCMYIVAAYLI
jgi:hypothetical protein